MNYQDKFNIYHDRKDRISGNGVLYSAYAAELDLYSSLELLDVKSKMKRLIIKDNDLNLEYTKRYFDNEKPDSIDNMVGFIKLGLLKSTDYESIGWYFRIGKDFYSKYSWFDFIKTAWKYRKELLEDRNYFRDNNLTVIGKLAYWIPWQYRYYMKKKEGRRVGLIEYLAFHLHVLFTSTIKDVGKDTSPKNIVVLMLEDLGSKYLIKLFNKKRQYTEYFGVDHDFVKKLEE